jgi:virginiamycin B lyase
MRLLRFVILFLYVWGFFGSNASAQQAASRPRDFEKKAMSQLQPAATFTLGGDPDWMAVSEDAVWVSISSLNRVTRLFAATNKADVSFTVHDPCSGLVAGFGSIWIPSCGDHSLMRANLRTAEIESTIPVPPADSEGCIAAGAGSIWIASAASGSLARIDPQNNSAITRIEIPSGSYCPVFADGFVWITSTEHSVLSKVDPSTNKVVGEIAVGRNPRFATAGAGAVWTLNQGDGTISRVDTATSKLVATIEAGLSGHGGEIAFGFGSVWVTLIGTPVTRIDAMTNSITRQWIGTGGDSIRAGFGSLWLTHLKAGLVWRLDPEKL